MDAKCFYSERDSAWIVEGIDFDNEGVGYRAIFTGIDSDKRAAEYALWKYGTTRSPE